MSLYCENEDYDGDSDWWWMNPREEAPLATKYSRKCCSCKVKIPVGAIAREVPRYRHPTDFEEERGIHSDEAPMASWYLCETCGDLSDSISELGLCYSLGGQSLQKQIAEYNAAWGVE